MIDVNKIKVGDKLRLTMPIAELPAGHVVTVTEDQTLGCNWITEELVEISELKGLESWFSIAEQISSMVPAERQYETIIITSPAYEYMGLMKGSKHKIHAIIDGLARFMCNGKLWELSDSYWEWDYPSDQIAVSKEKLESLGIDVENNKGSIELKPKVLTIPPEYFKGDLSEEKAKLLEVLKRGVGKDALLVPGVAEQPAPIKSDGGSSSYYTIPIPDDLLEKINQKKVIETEELIQTVFKNDFSFGTLFKSLIRAQGVVDGAGKAGNDLNYEMNKIIYYANQIKQIYGTK